MFWSVSNSFWRIVSGMESTVLVESVIWHEGGGEQKAGVPLGAMGFTSLSSGENSWQAQPRTGILCNWRNCSIQHSFSTDMEDQEKQRNSTDKNRTEQIWGRYPGEHSGRWWDDLRALLISVIYDFKPWYYCNISAYPIVNQERRNETAGSWKRQGDFC